MKNAMQSRAVMVMLMTLTAASPLCAEGGELVLEASLDTPEVLERLPLVARLVIRNAGEAPANIRFRQRDAALVERYSALILSREERVYRLMFVGGPQPNMPVLPPVHSLGPGDSIMIERVVTLIVRASTEQWSGDNGNPYVFIDPGCYTGHFEVDAAPGHRLVSNDFELKVVEAQGLDREVRDQVALRHVDFLEGRDLPMDETAYRGGESEHGVDRSRFKELQEILDSYPDSTYAHWIRFWKLYHHGPAEDALDYARKHPDFPLSDNMLLRVAKDYLNRKDYDQSRKVVDELLRDFPDGDARREATILQAGLAKKE